MGLILLNGTAYSGYDEPPCIYSEEEREVGVWIDGKPLYQKTIYIGKLLKDTSWHTVAHGISNIDKVVDITGIAIDENTQDFVPLTAFRPNSNQGVFVSSGVTNIEYVNNWLDADTRDTYVTLQYTKTTDVAGSGKWTTNGGLTHHYSTSEQVVGTWIDGKPLYEKQFHITSITANDNWQLIGNVAIKLLIDYECIGITSSGRSGNPTSFRSDRNTPQIQGDNTNGNLYYALISGTTISELYITARYTKTTD